MQFEREDLHRLNQLYRAANESVETLNKCLQTKVDDLETIVKEKDQQLKEYREENILLMRDLS